MNLIVVTIGGGIFLGIFGIVFYYALFKNFIETWKARKEIPRARTFIDQLDEKFPANKMTPEQQVEREKAIIESGFSLKAIEIAQTQKQKLQSHKTTDLDQLVDWFKKANENGMSYERAKEVLIYKGWNKRLVKKAYKKVKKIERGLIKKNGKEKQKPSLPNFYQEERGESIGIQSIDSGARTSNGARNGNGEIEHKRILPFSRPTTQSRDSSTTPRTQPKPRRDWESFKRNGATRRE